MYVDEGIGFAGQTVDEFPAARILHVRGKPPLAAADGVVDGQRTVDTRERIDAYDVGAQVSQQHSAKRSRSHATHHDDAYTVQWAGHWDHFLRCAAASPVACAIT
jgi:hypothetical protein